jgi:transposase
VGEGLVRRCVTEEIGKRLGAREVEEVPEFIGLDEFSVSGRRLYHTAICNLVKGEVMEVVEGQGRQKVEGYLDNLPDPERVKGVAMDMHEPFRQAVQMCLPQAKVVVDKFHFIRHVNKAMDKVRSRLQREETGEVRGETCSGAGILCSRELKGLLIGRRKD